MATSTPVTIVSLLIMRAMATSTHDMIPLFLLFFLFLFHFLFVFPHNAAKVSIVIMIVTMMALAVARRPRLSALLTAPAFFVFASCPN